LVQRIENVHPTVINAVEWCDTNPNLLVSASFSPTLKVHDVRRADNALFDFAGHSAPTRSSTILRPAWFNDLVVVGGDLGVISLYSATTGATISRGTLDGGACATVQCNALDGSLRNAVNRACASFAPSIGGCAAMCAAVCGAKVQVLRGMVENVAAE
jgi:WD40 repeat protein